MLGRLRIEVNGLKNLVQMLTLLKNPLMNHNSDAGLAGPPPTTCFRQIQALRNQYCKMVNILCES